MTRQSFKVCSGAGIHCLVHRSKRTKRFISQAVLYAGLFLVTSLSPAWSDTYPKNPDIEILHYAIRLSLSDGTDEIIGETTVDVRFFRQGVSEFALDLEPVQGDGDSYRLPIEIDLKFDEDAGTRRERIELTGQHQVCEIPADRAPISIVLDPDFLVLMDTEFSSHPWKQR